MGKPDELLNLPVKFGRVSFGKGSSGIAFTIERSQLTLEKADKLLCGMRLTARLAAGGSGDPDQQLLFEDMTYHVDGIFECRRLGVGTEDISGSLNLLLEDGTAVDEIAHLAGKVGQLIVSAVAVMEADVKPE